VEMRAASVEQEVPATPVDERNIARPRAAWRREVAAESKGIG